MNIIIRFLVLIIFAGALFLGAFYFYLGLTDALELAGRSALISADISGRYLEFLRSEALKRNKEYELIFVGDVMLSRGIAMQIRKYKNPRYPFMKIADVISSADLAFGNLEGPISDRGKNQGSIYSFRAKPQVGEGLKFAGFDVLSLANNHILDWGPEAAQDTVDVLEGNGILPVGAGKNYEMANKPSFVDLGGTLVVFFAYTNLYPKGFNASEDQTGVSDFDLEKIKKKISEVRSKANLVIVSMHWGEEYQPESSSNQKEVARFLIDSGADLIVGHHPHVAQEIEKYRDRWIIYSLGNFVFDQNFSDETMAGLLAKVKVKRGQILDVSPVKIKISQTFQPYVSRDEN